MLKELPFANALGATMGVLYVACTILVAIFPDFSRNLAITWIHGFNLSQIPAADARLGSEFFLGLISAVVAAWIFGYVLAWTYNRLAK